MLPWRPKAQMAFAWVSKPIDRELKVTLLWFFVIWRSKSRVLVPGVPCWVTGQPVRSSPLVHSHRCGGRGEWHVSPAHFLGVWQGSPQSVWGWKRRNWTVWHLRLTGLRHGITTWLVWAFYAFLHQKLWSGIFIALGSSLAWSPAQCQISDDRLSQQGRCMVPPKAALA